QVRRSGAEDLVSDPLAPQPRVARLRLHGVEPSPGGRTSQGPERLRLVGGERVRPAGELLADDRIVLREPREVAKRVLEDLFDADPRGRGRRGSPGELDVLERDRHEVAPLGEGRFGWKSGSGG